MAVRGYHFPLYVYSADLDCSSCAQLYDCTSVSCNSRRRTDVLHFGCHSGKEAKAITFQLQLATFFVQVANKVLHIVSYMGNRGLISSNVKDIFVLLLEKNLVYHVCYLGFCFAGLFVHEFFYSILVRSIACIRLLSLVDLFMCCFSCWTLFYAKKR